MTRAVDVGAGVGALWPDVRSAFPDARVLGVDRSAGMLRLAPAATPREIVQKLADGIQRATRDPETRRRLTEQGAAPVGNTPEEFAKLLREEVARWAEVVKVSGARAD